MLLKDLLILVVIIFCFGYKISKHFSNKIIVVKFTKHQLVGGEWGVKNNTARLLEYFRVSGEKIQH
jgi:hypothetical protein